MLGRFLNGNTMSILVIFLSRANKLGAVIGLVNILVML